MTKKTKSIIGIDPGFSGAIAFLNRSSSDYLLGSCLKIYDLPLQMHMGRRQVDPKALTQYIQNYQASFCGISFAIVEDVSAMPGQGVTSMFRFGYNAGILLGVLGALGIETLKTPSKVWKSALNLTRNKKDSLKMARKLFPDNTKDFTRVKDDGRAEAALIAYFAKISF